LRPKVLACLDCDIKVEGPFQLNEFATLAPDDLHFLRIFVRSEGRIRDMETALGLSYPTIRARLTALKNKLSGESSEDESGAEAKPSAAEKTEESQDVGRILQRLQAGEIPFDEAMNQIKRLRAKPR
jgi:hypothetical protein